MTTTTETTKAVQEAAERLELARMDAQRISDLMNRQPAAFDAQPIAKARQKAEDLSAAVMLGEASQETLDNARAEVTNLEFEEATAAFEARQLAEGRAGLERRLSDAQGAVEAAEGDLVAATKDWLMAELIDADTAYTKAAEQVAAAHARVHAAGSLLSDRRACPNTTSCAIPLQLPVIGPVSIGKTANSLNGGARTYMWIAQDDFQRTRLLMELKSLGALWPVISDR